MHCLLVRNATVSFRMVFWNPRLCECFPPSSHSAHRILTSTVRVYVSTTIGVLASADTDGITDGPPVPTITESEPEATGEALGSDEKQSGVKVILPAVIGSVIIAALAAAVSSSSETCARSAY